MKEQAKIIHLYARAAFGIPPKLLKERSSWTVDQAVNRLFQDATSVNHLRLLPFPLKGDKEASSFKVLRMVLKSPKQLKQLNIHWLRHMGRVKGTLRERMTLFWHGHFATRTPMAYLMQEQNNTLRKYALGSFRTLLHAVAKDPAMLVFLNNQQNKKYRPNENFARELMELFTLGEGVAYTEQDIKEAARAFTGWTVNKKGRFEVEEKHHDTGQKTFLGKTGAFSGEDIIDIILEQPEVARFIVRKVYVDFVSERIDENIVTQLADDFRANDYDISALLRQIFTADWFYDRSVVGYKVKSPAELLVGYKQALKHDMPQEKLYLHAQHQLGQLLFFPPSVAGWSNGQDWIDGQSLLFRMRIPILTFGVQDLAIRPPHPYKGQGFYNMGERGQARLDAFKASIDWGSVIRSVAHLKDEAAVLKHLCAWLIPVPIEDVDLDKVEQFLDRSARSSLVKSAVIHLMALPEYQLC